MNTTILIFAIIVILAFTAVLVFLLIRRRSKKPPIPPSRLEKITVDSDLSEHTHRERLPIPSLPQMKDSELQRPSAPRPSIPSPHPSMPSAPAARPPRPQKVSITHPKLLSKGYASLFIVQIYLPEMRYQAAKTIAKEFGTQKVAEHTWDIQLEIGLKARIKLSSPVLSFSDPVIKQIKNGVTVARFTAIPNDDCKPGTHYVVLSITDAETQFEYESISFAVAIVDFAFDHLSRPLLSKATSAVLGLGSLMMFVLTALEQVDKTFGLTAGTAAAVLTSAVLLQWWSLFQRPGVTHTP
jgi:hypothetical protein